MLMLSCQVDSGLKMIVVYAILDLDQAISNLNQKNYYTLVGLSSCVNMKCRRGFNFFLVKLSCRTNPTDLRGWALGLSGLVGQVGSGS